MGPKILLRYLARGLLVYILDGAGSSGLTAPGQGTPGASRGRKAWSLGGWRFPEIVRLPEGIPIAGWTGEESPEELRGSSLTVEGGHSR